MGADNSKLQFVQNNLREKTIQYLYWQPGCKTAYVHYYEHMVLRVFESPYDTIFSCNKIKRMNSRGEIIHSLCKKELKDFKKYVKSFGGGAIKDVVAEHYKRPGYLWGNYNVMDLILYLDDGSNLVFVNVNLNPCLSEDVGRYSDTEWYTP
jgi:hypothetical protein